MTVERNAVIKTGKRGKSREANVRTARAGTRRLILITLENGQTIRIAVTPKAASEIKAGL